MMTSLFIEALGMRALVVSGLIATLVGLTACTAQGWYEGQRHSARNECERIFSEPERVRCLAKHDDDFESYSRKRQAVTEGRAEEREHAR